MHTILLAVACVGIALGGIGCGLAAWLIWATRDARDTAHRHERRTRDQGPPEGQPERRHRNPDDARARRRDLDDPQWRVEHVEHLDVRRTDRPQDVRREDPATYPPRPAPRHRSPEDESPSTVEPAPPTADMRTLPPPGSIHR